MPAMVDPHAVTIRHFPIVAVNGQARDAEVLAADGVNRPRRRVSNREIPQPRADTLDEQNNPRPPVSVILSRLVIERIIGAEKR